MLVKDPKMALFMRLAAILILLSVTMAVLSDLVYYVYSEANDFGFISLIRYMGSNFGLYSISLLLGHLITLLVDLTIPVLNVIIIVMLFAAKEKPSGILIIVSGIVAFTGKIISFLLTLVEILAGMFIEQFYDNNDLLSFLKSSTKSAFKDIAAFVIILLLGLLLIGVFKKASKVVGFILMGLFLIAWIFTCVDFIDEVVWFVNECIDIVKFIRETRWSIFEYKYQFVRLLFDMIYLVYPVASGLKYIACALLSLGAALRKRDNVTVVEEVTSASEF